MPLRPLPTRIFAVGLVLGAALLAVCGAAAAASCQLKDGEIRVLMPDGCRDEFLAYWDREASAVPMSRVSHIDHRQIITVQVNDRDVRALIDSGAYRSMIDAASAGRLGVTRET